MTAMLAMPDVTALPGPTGLVVEALVRDVPSPRGLVVFLPGALSPKREDRSMPVFHRWSWAEDLPDFAVLTIADPALRQDAELDGAWFIHPEVDVVREIAAVVLEHARERGLGPDKILFYGSSLGGFGALAAAAAARARAVAEVPQIDFRGWLPGAVRAVEKRILGMTVTEYRRHHPERVDVWSRFLFERYVPPFTMISNEADRCFPQQLKLISTIRSSTLYRAESADLLVTARTHEHQTLQRAVALRAIRAALPTEG